MASITIKGSAVKLIEQMNNLPAQVDMALAEGLSSGLLYAVSVSQRQYLSGPRPTRLDIRTRRLRDSIDFEVEIDKVLVAKNFTRSSGTVSQFRGSGDIRGRTGTNVPYGAYHEYGFHGQVEVRAHTRTVATLDVSGAPIDERRRTRANKAGEVFFLESRTSAAGKSGSRAAFTFTQNVRAHTRMLNYDGRPFIKPAIEDSKPQIDRELGRSLKSINPS